MKAGEVGKAAYLGRIASFIPSVSDREGLAGMAAAGYHPRLQAKKQLLFPTRYCDSRPAPQLDNHTGKQSLDWSCP
jgi:hypothetical protein